MKRYQNPDVFEPLAMGYALGTLRGKARLRFEKLQARHYYLRAVTAAYQQQFAALGEILPPQPPPQRVWENISKALDLTATNTSAAPASRSWLSKYLPWSVASFASVAVAVLGLMLLNPHKQPSAYMATLKSVSQTDMMMVATVSRGAMKISFDMPSGALPASDDMMPTFWCIPKDSSKAPMRMGTLTPGGDMNMPIDRETWRDMANVSAFAISLEPMDQPPAATPMGEVMFSGELTAF